MSCRLRRPKLASSQRDRAPNKSAPGKLFPSNRAPDDKSQSNASNTRHKLNVSSCLAVALISCNLFAALIHNQVQALQLTGSSREQIVLASPEFGLQSEAEGNNHKPANNEKPFASMLHSAVINGKANLACDISPANSDDSVALILWYKDDSLAPIYTIDARKASSLDKAKTSLDEAYASRASFNMKTKPAQLQLEPVRQEDEGDYRCRVDFKRGRTVNTIISLRVLVLPDEVRIFSPQRAREPKLEGLIGPFNEGNELTLVCLASGGKPKPQITWRRDFNVIDETYQHVDKEGTSNELKIPSLNKNHLLSIFTCQASNTNITSPIQTSITLDLNLKPQEISLRQLVKEPLVVGQTATFECLTQGSRPQATIHWLFQGIRHDTPMNVDQQQTSSRLTLSLQRSFNQQPLICVAENPRIGQSSGLRQTIKLDVHYLPQLSIRLEPPLGQQQQTTIWAGQDADAHEEDKQQQQQQLQRPKEITASQLQEGNDIYLTCLLDANPRPPKPTLWRFNGSVLQQSSNMIVMNNQSLVLRKVSRQQSGAYTCEATNQLGTNTSKPMNLVIRHAPVCSTDDVLVFEASIGQTLSIDCNVHANPAKSVHYSWFSAAAERNLSNWLARDAALDEQIDESSSRLRFKVKDESSFALLKCKAKNEIGIQQRACLFQIIQALPPPSLRRSCSLLNATTNSLQLQCEPNEHLKSEEFELVGGQTGSSSSSSSSLSSSAIGHSASSGWLNFGPFGGLQPNGDANSNGQPNMCLVFPPNWLMAELYKQTSGPNESSISASESGSGEQSYELIAYVVIGSSEQLSRIKSIVEENRLFSSNPKSVYYVIAKQTKPQTSSSLASIPQADHSVRPMNGSPDSQLLGLRAEAYRPPSPIIHQASNAAGRPSLIEDPSIQLASSFSFTVPSLEPQTKYKLLIYGQNLANKTRDWLAVRGETLGDGAYLRPTMRNQDLVGANLISLGENNNNNNNRLFTSNERQNFSSMGQQKSIVMRSDQPDSASTAGDQLLAEQPIDLASQSNEASLAARSASLRLKDHIRQLSLYSDFAISYARQKPLLAVPMALTMLILLLLLVVWSSSLLVALARRRGGRGVGPATGRGQLAGAGKTAPADESAIEAKLGVIGGGGQLTGQFLSSPGASYSSSGSNQERSEPNYASAGTPVHQNSSAPLLLNERPHQHGQQQQTTGRGATVYAIDDSRLLELDCGGFNQAELAKIYHHQQQQQKQQQHFLGSLDRRIHNQPIYLAEAPGGQTFFQVPSAGQHSRLQRADFGSIDRKMISSSSFIQETSRNLTNKQPIVLAEFNPNNTAGLYHIHNTNSTAELAAQVSSSHYNQGSFSSTECSSELINPNHVAASARIPAANNLRGRHQRVAFDLSNQQALELSSSSGPAMKQQQQQYLYTIDGKPEQNQSGKGSDSGGSNSGATGDSGHESPPTGETTTTSANYTAIVVAQPQNEPSRAGCRHLAISSISPSDIHQVAECCDKQQSSGNGNNLVMLMELSPGSQESSTLLQSVDSFVEISAPLVSSAAGVCRQLHNNHQMATSFTSGSACSDLSQPFVYLDAEQPANFEQASLAISGQDDISNWL